MIYHFYAAISLASSVIQPSITWLSHWRVVWCWGKSKKSFWKQGGEGVYCPCLIALTTVDFLFFFNLFPVEVNILISLLDITICGDLVSLPSLCFQTLCSIISGSFLLEFVWLLLTPENSLNPSHDNSIKLF